MLPGPVDFGPGFAIIFLILVVLFIGVVIGLFFLLALGVRGLVNRASGREGPRT